MAPIINIFERAKKILELSKVNHNIPKKENNSQIIPYKSDIIKSDYIKLGIKDIEKNFDENNGFDIAIGRTEFNKNHEKQNISLLEKGLRMSNIPQYMEFHNTIWNAYQNNKPLFNSEGDEISRKVIKDLYRQVTSDEWVNLNAKFEENASGIWTVKQAVGLDENKNIIYDSKIISIPIQENCFVNPKAINKEGFSTEKSKKQEFKRGKNIYFHSPLNGKVAVFGAYDSWANLGCCGYPSDWDSNLGVRATKLRE